MKFQTLAYCIPQLLIMTASLGLSSRASALCTTLIKGPVVIDVKECRAVLPEQSFASGDSKYSFIRDLPPANRKQFLSTYRGSLVQGTVIQSQAIRQGMSADKGALLDEPISAFIPAGAGSCETVSAKSIEVQLSQSCCDGGGEAPCLLDTGYVLRDVKISDVKAAGRAAADKRSPESQVFYAKAKAALGIRDFKAAAQALETLRAKNDLDVLGQYQLAAIYRELDKCAAALPILAGLQTRFEKKDYWTATETAVRKGSFLYARCLSVLGKSSESVLVLQGFLVEKTRFRKEIKDSITHRDFGYIRTSKIYSSYKKSAEKALIPSADDPQP